MTVLQLATSLANALAPHVSATDITSLDAARIVANNAAMSIDAGFDPAFVLETALLHYRAHGWISIQDLEAAVADGVRACGALLVNAEKVAP